ncbi:MAG: DMT family transporter [Gemmatimonadaceae bacterium]|nr:DMT family transporter [Gemmatimonadaceae bacterium]MBX9855509.1 DMT family transporter [Gemmatimonadaceae bacterium]
MSDASAARWRGTLAVIASACAFGSISPLTVLATGDGMALESVQSWRYLTSAVLLLTLGFLRRSAPPSRSSSVLMTPWYHPRILLPTGGGQALVATLALAALRWLPASTASFLFYTYPAWVALLSAARGLEPLDRLRLAALGLALGGVAAMVGAPDAASLDPVGLAVILAAAVVYALYIPYLNHIQQGRDAYDVARAIGVGGALCFVAWSATTGSLWQIPSALAFGASVLQGLLGAVAFLGFLSGLRLLGAVRTAITSTVEPFWTTLLGIVVLQQPLGAGTIVGGVLIMAAVLLLQRRPRGEARS